MTCCRAMVRSPHPWQRKQQQQAKERPRQGKISPQACTRRALILGEPVQEQKSADKGATLRELCAEDKGKIARLIRQVVSVTKEKDSVAQRLKEEQDQSTERINRLRTQNRDLVTETSSLRAKLAHAYALLRTYQHKVQLLKDASNTEALIGPAHAKDEGGERIDLNKAPEDAPPSSGQGGDKSSFSKRQAGELVQVQSTEEHLQEADKAQQSRLNQDLEVTGAGSATVVERVGPKLATDTATVDLKEETSADMASSIAAPVVAAIPLLPNQSLSHPNLATRAAAIVHCGDHLEKEQQPIPYIHQPAVQRATEHGLKDSKQLKRLEADKLAVTLGWPSATSPCQRANPASLAGQLAPTDSASKPATFSQAEQPVAADSAGLRAQPASPAKQSASGVSAGPKLTASLAGRSAPAESADLKHIPLEQAGTAPLKEGWTLRFDPTAGEAGAFFYVPVGAEDEFEETSDFEEGERLTPDEEDVNDLNLPLTLGNQEPTPFRHSRQQAADEMPAKGSSEEIRERSIGGLLYDAALLQLVDELELDTYEPSPKKREGNSKGFRRTRRRDKHLDGEAGLVVNEDRMNRLDPWQSPRQQLVKPEGVMKVYEQQLLQNMLDADDEDVLFLLQEQEGL